MEIDAMAIRVSMKEETTESPLLGAARDMATNLWTVSIKQ
jgi:hypothetical protein